MGYSKIASLGVGIGGFGSVKNAKDLVGPMTISVPMSAMGMLLAKKEDLSTPYPKFFIPTIDTSGFNGSFTKGAQIFYDLSVEPKELIFFNSRYLSMDLFKSEHKTELNELIIKFFKNINDKF